MNESELEAIKIAYFSITGAGMGIVVLYWLYLIFIYTFGLGYSIFKYYSDYSRSLAKQNSPQKFQYRFIPKSDWLMKKLNLESTFLTLPAMILWSFWPVIPLGFVLYGIYQGIRHGIRGINYVILKLIRWYHGG
jgi:hypothetical protein